MAEPNLDEVAKLAGALGIGAIAKSVLDWWRARQSRTEELEAKASAAPGAVMAGAAEFQAALVATATDLLEDYRTQLAFVRRRCDELEAGREADHRRYAGLEVEIQMTRRELEETKAELARSMVAHSNCEEALAGMRAQIAGLMAEKPQTPPVLIGRPPRRRRARKPKAVAP